MEEGSIAKGIRRIIAVTGEEAAALARNYENILPTVTRLDTLPVTELEAALREVDQELNSVALPAVEKAALRKKYDAAKARFDDADKKRKAEVGKQAAEKIKEALEKNAAGGFVVVSVPVEGNAKILATAVQQGTKGFADKAAIMVVSSDATEQTIYQCSVPKVRIVEGCELKVLIQSLTTYPPTLTVPHRKGPHCYRMGQRNLFPAQWSSRWPKRKRARTGSAVRKGGRGARCRGTVCQAQAHVDVC